MLTLDLRNDLNMLVRSRGWCARCTRRDGLRVSDRRATFLRQSAPLLPLPSSEPSIHRLEMGKKSAKATRKYAASGKLKNEIQARKKHQQIKRNIERRKSGKPKKGLASEEREYLEDERAGQRFRAPTRHSTLSSQLDVRRPLFPRNGCSYVKLNI